MKAPWRMVNSSRLILLESYRQVYYRKKMKKEEKDLLRQKELMSELKPRRRTLTKGGGFRNADKTGYDAPKVGETWKEYWQIFTQEDFPTTCPFCGKPLAQDDVDGCHINFRRYKLFEKENEANYKYDEEKYIIPGHHDCNLKYNAEFESKIEVAAVEAIKK